MVLLTDGEYPGIETGHGLGGLLDRLVWTRDANIPRHGFTDFHRYLLSSSCASCPPPGLGQWLRAVLGAVIQHDLADRGVAGRSILRDRAHDDIAVGHHSNNSFCLAYRWCSDILA